MDAFNDELNSFKERVKGRAQARIQAAMEQAEEVFVFAHTHTRKDYLSSSTKNCSNCPLFALISGG